MLSHIHYRIRSILFKGKTLFNLYLLIRLLQRKQVVLFSPDGRTVYLFYHNEVYKARMVDLERDFLPIPIPSSKAFIWSLFDIRKPEEPELFMVSHPCFPVQTALPDPIRYHTWRKKRDPLLTGLPLWTREELVQGYVLPITHFCPCLSPHCPG